MALAMAAPPSAACAFHGASAINGAVRPHAVYVALAMHQATLDGSLAPSPAAPAALGLLRVNRLLHDVARALDGAAPAGRASGSGFALLVADVGLWSRYRVDQRAVEVETHVDGPGTDVVVVTGEAVLAALTGGHMSAAQAVHKGLIAIVGDDEKAARVATLLITAL